MAKFTNQQIEKILNKYSFPDLNKDEVKETLEKLRDIDEICEFISFSHYDGRRLHYNAEVMDNVVDVRIYSWSHVMSNELFDPTDKHKAFIEISTKYLAENYTKTIELEINVPRDTYLTKGLPKYCSKEKYDELKRELGYAVRSTTREWIMKNIPLAFRIQPLWVLIDWDCQINLYIKDIYDELEKVLKDVYQGYSPNNLEAQRVARRLNNFFEDAEEKGTLEKDLEQLELAIKYYLKVEDMDRLAKIFDKIKKGE